MTSRNWLINISEIQTGHSAILNNNYLTFYGIHSIAIILILISFLSSVTVIIYILAFSRKDRWDFPDRFPLYLAIASVLYGLSSLIGHVILITTKHYPEKNLDDFLSINFFIFSGYEQFLHAGLATYTYLKVVRHTSLNLGRAEWRLQLFCFTVLGILVIMFYPMDAFGNSGYWFLADVKNSSGICLGFTVSFSSTIHALCTSLCFWSIKRAVEAHQNTIADYKSPSKGGTGTRNNSQSGRHSTATECLTVYIRISLCLYFPAAFGAWTFMILADSGVIEPFIVLFIVIVVNSRGWAYALAYWYNKKIKDRNPKSSQAVPTQSTISNSKNLEI